MSKKPKLILASSSPRRKRLLAELGIPFEVVEPTGVDEELVGGAAFLRSQELARRKAEWVLQEAAPEPGTLVLGADTIVALVEGREEVILGKPQDREHSRETLTRLSGRTHRVITGVAVASPGRETKVAAEVSLVTFRALTAEEIEAYLETGEPEGRAGAYAIEETGRSLIAGIRGCYYNVVGLPLGLVRRLISADPAYTCSCGAHPLQLGAEGCRGE